MQQASDRVVTDSVQIVEGADGVKMDLLAETVENGKVPEPGATAEYTEVGAAAADTAEVQGVAVMLDFSRPQRRR